MGDAPWWTWWLSGVGAGWCARSLWAWCQDWMRVTGKVTDVQ